MFFKNKYIILFAVCLLSILGPKPVLAYQTSNDLMEMISRIGSDIAYRQSLGIKEPQLLTEFYESNHYAVQWFSVATDISRRNKFLYLLSEPAKYMLEPGDYSATLKLLGNRISTRTDTLYAELRFTDAALHFLREIAYPDVPMLKYNGWQYKPGCIAISSLLQQALTSGDIEHSITEAEPENIQYRKLRSAYEELYALSLNKNFKEITVENKTVSITNTNLVNKLRQLGYMAVTDTTATQLSVSLTSLQLAHNLPVQATISTACYKVLNEPVKNKLREFRWNIRWYRWLSCMQNKSYILVNIAANRLSYFECNEEVLNSRIVVGKTSTPTPTMTAVIKNVIYYPYWNVPFSIATKEMLPKLKRNPHYLDRLKIEVLQGGHTYPSSSVISWNKYSQRNFPFNFRQLPGCHNSLGRLKFDFENPFHTYLHDTNDKTVFGSTKRFFSHGCIRIEKPYDLALALGVAANQVNMDSCLTGMKPQVIPLNHVVPVFIIYATVDIIDGRLTWFEDTYRKRAD